MKLSLLGLGSSLGDRIANLHLVIVHLSYYPNVQIMAVSSIYESPPLGCAEQLFLNSTVLIRSKHTPLGLLKICKDIEKRMGRVKSTRWSDRIIDIDILLFEGVRMSSKYITLPHPEMLKRDFVIVPAIELVGDWVLPDGRCLSDCYPPNKRLWKFAIYNLAVLPRMHYKETTQTREDATMKFFIDTANIDEIREAFAMGIVDGVTTNPSLIAREGGDYIQTLYDICELVQGPVSAETVSQDADGMVKEGLLLAQIHEHIVVKVPLTTEGLKATSRLSSEGIAVNVTLCFQPAQALLAAKAGAAYISPFVGRLDDISHDGSMLIEEICRIFDNYPDLTTEVLAASIRHPMHLIQAALAGAHVATIPFSVIKKLVNHPLTDSGNVRFLKDWETVPNNNISENVQNWLNERAAKG